MSSIHIKQARAKVNEILNGTGTKSISERIINLSLIALIFLNVVAVILETEKAIFLKYSAIFEWFEFVSVTIFSLEYILRFWCCRENSKYQKPFFGHVKYAFTPMALVDLLAILPFYLPLLIPFDLRFLRALRMFRIFRLFKIGHYIKSLRTIDRVLREKKEELLITIFSVVILLVLSSSLMYFIEHEVQPDKFTSIPAAMWWGIATLTTIGYGDIYPISTMGKILGSFIALLGIGLFALPAGILASGFASEIQKKSKKEKKCPHCGHSLDN